MRHLTAALLIGVLAAPALASHTVRTGRRTYTIDVRNQYFRDIWRAYVRVTETGDTSAWIEVRADGYRDARLHVTMPAAQTNVHVQVTMQDPTVQVYLVDKEGHAISGAWVDQNQFTADADEYMLRIRMPSEGFTKFTRSDVRIDFMFANWINVWGSGANRRVEIRLPRRELGSSWFVTLRVRIPSDAQLEQAKREAERLKRFERLHVMTR
jgi:hypothetical protein